jgi:hypothetical protein
MGVVILWPKGPSRSPLSNRGVRLIAVERLPRLVGVGLVEPCQP